MGHGGLGSKGTGNRHKPCTAQKPWTYSGHLLEHFVTNHVAKRKRFAPDFCNTGNLRNPGLVLALHNLRLLRHVPFRTAAKWVFCSFTAHTPIRTENYRCPFAHSLALFTLPGFLLGRSWVRTGQSKNIDKCLWLLEKSGVCVELLCDIGRHGFNK